MTDQENNKNEFDGVVVVDFQIVVSHVCHSWRRIALKMPMLWDRIVFIHAPPYKINKTKTFIERSKNVDLDILLCEREKDGESTLYFTKEFEELLSFIRVIKDHVHRWRRFSVFLKYRADLNVILDYLHDIGPAPRLVYLTLANCPQYTGPYDAYDASYLTIFDNDVPLLEEVSLSDVGFYWEKTTFLRDLVYLNLNYDENPHYRPTPGELASILLASPNMEILSVSDFNSLNPGVDPMINSSDGWPIEPISLNSLEELTIELVYPLHAKNFINRLKFTNLTELKLGLFWKVDASESDAIIANEIYTTLSSVTMLTLLSIGYENPFVTTLRNPKVLPKLFELAIVATNDNSDGLEDVILSRFEGDVVLSVLVLMKGMIKEESLDWLEEHVDVIRLVSDVYLTPVEDI